MIMGKGGTGYLLPVYTAANPFPATKTTKPHRALPRWDRGTESPSAGQKGGCEKLIEVWSRLWPSTVTGRRSYRNTLALVRDVANRMVSRGLPLIVTDGFDFYAKSSVASSGQLVSTVRFSRHEGTIVCSRSNEEPFMEPRGVSRKCSTTRRTRRH